MRSFKDMKNGRGSTEAKADAEQLDAGSLIEKYSGMSEEKLLNELLSATSKQKADGTFDYDSVRKGMDAIMPMLNDQQRKRLIEITKMI